MNDDDAKVQQDRSLGQAKGRATNQAALVDVGANRKGGCTLRLVLGDQLSRSLSALDGLDAARDVVLMIEARDETIYVRHHKQKLVLVLSAMRHFAEELRREGITVDYIHLDDVANTGSFSGEISRALQRHRVTAIVATEPGEWRVLQMMEDWREEIDVPVHIRPDHRFIASRDDFSLWARDRKTYRMEFFYREMRRKTGLLMIDGEPVGGQWNFDQDNRKRLPASASVPERLRFGPDPITQTVIDMVRERFPDHFGDLDNFGWPVTRADALSALQHFVSSDLARYGDYQDAMKTGEPFLFHALLSPCLNIGLLLPLEVCAAAENAYREGLAPLNAVEGFIRQIIGWREYVRGFYWFAMPDYAAGNALAAHRKLPWFYWSGETAMNCLHQCISETRRNAYAHHIQRLMVLGNFALLAGLDPREVEEWYLVVYADAYEWVELPNVHGMALWADGGMLASKPYAASGAYIDRMSDYCSACHFNVKLKVGERACPFNYLYWNFLIENESRLGNLARMAMPYRNLDRLLPAQKAQMRDEARRFLGSLQS
jgi:deoxyribodipyrimidine photolyase-related protein